MFIISNGSNIVSIHSDKSTIVGMLRTLKEQLTHGYNTNQWTRSSYSTVEAYLGAYMRSYKVYQIPDFFDNSRGLYQIAQNDGTVDITHEFFLVESVELIAGHKISADVIRKGLASSGKTVTVNPWGTFNPRTTVEEYANMAGTLARIPVTVNGYGTLFLSPNSLGNYRVENVMKTGFELITAFE